MSNFTSRAREARAAVAARPAWQLLGASGIIAASLLQFVVYAIETVSSWGGPTVWRTGPVDQLAIEAVLWALMAVAVAALGFGVPGGAGGRGVGIVGGARFGRAAMLLYVLFSFGALVVQLVQLLRFPPGLTVDFATIADEVEVYARVGQVMHTAAVLCLIGTAYWISAAKVTKGFARWSLFVYIGSSLLSSLAFAVVSLSDEFMRGPVATVLFTVISCVLFALKLATGVSYLLPMNLSGQGFSLAQPAVVEAPPVLGQELPDTLPAREAPDPVLAQEAPDPVLAREAPDAVGASDADQAGFPKPVTDQA